MRAVADSRGDIPVRMESEQGGFLVAEIDPAAAMSKKANEFNDLADGRRTPQYSLRYGFLIFISDFCSIFRPYPNSLFLHIVWRNHE